jgi:hypothetical protein
VSGPKAIVTKLEAWDEKWKKVTVRYLDGSGLEATILVPFEQKLDLKQKITIRATELT